MSSIINLWSNFSAAQMIIWISLSAERSKQIVISSLIDNGIEHHEEMAFWKVQQIGLKVYSTHSLNKKL